MTCFRGSKMTVRSAVHCGRLNRKHRRPWLKRRQQHPVQLLRACNKTRQVGVITL